MPGSNDSDRATSTARNDEFEDIEVLRNLLEIRTRLRKEKIGIETELE